jgi:macrolide-specific efflux system membrane fusion protein
MDVYFTTLGGNNRRHYGKLRQIPPTPTVVNNVVLYDALFDVENPKQELMTQMTAQVFFVAASAKDAVLVPLAALRPVEGRPRGPRTPSADKAGSGAAEGKNATEGKGVERGGGAGREPGAARKGGGERAGKGGGERASGLDARSLYANGRALVAVVGADGKVADREVKVGVMNRVSAQILSGLEPGEKVVIGTKSPAAAVKAQASSSLAPKAPKGGGFK